MPLFKFHGPYKLHLPELFHKHGKSVTVAPGDVVELDSHPGVPGFSQVKDEPPKEPSKAPASPAPATPPASTPTPTALNKPPEKSSTPDIPTTQKKDQ